VYRCADGYRFVVRFEPQRAWLFMDGTTTSVPQVPTRSGLLYTNRLITFAKEGSDARLRLQGTTAAEHERCVNQPAEAERALK
jgi:membrane-bound inhibitor of C-type lysozyme